MKDSFPLPENKKLSVTYRVESGCLGPEGEQHISAFCSFAQSQIKALDSDFISWVIIPRDDKSLPEMQYSIVGKGMSHSQAEKYLLMFDKDLDEFEGHLVDRLSSLIDEYWSR